MKQTGAQRRGPRIRCPRCDYGNLTRVGEQYRCRSCKHLFSATGEKASSGSGRIAGRIVIRGYVNYPGKGSWGRYSG